RVPTPVTAGINPSRFVAHRRAPRMSRFPTYRANASARTYVGFGYSLDYRAEGRGFSGCAASLEALLSSTGDPGPEPAPVVAEARSGRGGRGPGCLSELLSRCGRGTVSAAK